ncbi:hypothetical protein [Umezawaea sp.]|uniref:hypothetical protein n=1 Tax=Umezawaea sp. TaxID=1955258 RepID=UPI002ED0AB88
MKISLRRVVAACALAAPLALGTSGVALADAYEAYDASAGPDGASLDIVEAAGHHHDYYGGFPGAGGALVEFHSVAGPDGVSSEWLYATVGEDGEVTYVQGQDTAGPDGATSTGVAAAGSDG